MTEMQYYTRLYWSLIGVAACVVLAHILPCLQLIWRETWRANYSFLPVLVQPLFLLVRFILLTLVISVIGIFFYRVPYVAMMFDDGPICSAALYADDEDAMMALMCAYCPNGCKSDGRNPVRDMYVSIFVASCVDALLGCTLFKSRNGLEFPRTELRFGLLIIYGGLLCWIEYANVNMTMSDLVALQDLMSDNDQEMQLPLARKVRGAGTVGILIGIGFVSLSAGSKWVGSPRVRASAQYQGVANSNNELELVDGTKATSFHEMQSGNTGDII